jgi:hypothetical protein
VGGRAQVLELLAGEDVDGDKMDLGMAVLAGLGGGHLDNLAGAVLDHHEAVLAQGGALHRVRGRGTGVGALEGVALMLGRSADGSWCVGRGQARNFGECMTRRLVQQTQHTYLGVVGHGEARPWGSVEGGTVAG